ncbi:MAG TPA: ATP-dependent DNA helicase RecG [Candidatus Obscuribacterales bacterium]
MTTKAHPGANREAEVSALKRAIEVERRARYADFQGRRSTFSQFMRQTADRLCRRYPVDARWATIRGLFRQYPNLDVATRISIVRRVEELLDAVPEYCRQAGAASPGTDAMAAPAGCSPEPARPPDHAMPSAGRRSLAASPAPAQAAGAAPLPAKEAAAGDHRVVQPVGEIDVKFVRGVGPKLAAVLNNLGIYTVADLLRHYPRRHLDFQNRLMIRDLVAGQEVTVFGTIRSVGAFQSKKGNVSVLSVVIGDGTGTVTVTRFVGGKSNKYLLDRYKEQFPKGAQVLASGTVEVDRFRGRFQLKNAEIEILGGLTEPGEEVDTIHTGRLVPVYPLTEGLSLRYLRLIIHNALEAYGERLEDVLPEPVRQKYELLDLRSALKQIHFPEDKSACEQARRRLVFDELFAIQLLLAFRRHRTDTQESGLAFNVAPDGLVSRCRALLPFTLTSAQERVFQEIARDLASPRPMQRLVQGDVGSGKTVVAILAFLVAIENGFQCAMMAPTEILAEQHYRQLLRYLTPLGLRCALVTGKQGQKERRLIQQDLLSGQIHVAVGTHALIQEGVEFNNLGLIIIDEQHRFGVRQRASLKAKGQNPELLSMTATPIPRTLALTLHGDLDVSEIDELPPGRAPVATKLIAPAQKRELWSFLRSEIEKGRQAYVVFPLIEESETLAAKAATVEYEKLRTGVFQDLRLGLMHGKLKPAEKDEVMEKFRAGDLDILVSTTVIEVGVDVPNATVMVIENADRFGLAQLHQLRGRVGLGANQSYCFLVADVRSETTRQRLEIMTQTNDGFVIAEKDLQLRGPGEFLGVAQSGLPDLLLADLVRDARTLEQARQAAIALVKSDPELSRHPRLRRLVDSRMASQEADLVGSG